MLVIYVIHAQYNFTYHPLYVHGANMGPIWGQQDPDWPHVGLMNFAIWVILHWAPEFTKKASLFMLLVIHIQPNYLTQATDTESTDCNIYHYIN